MPRPRRSSCIPAMSGALGRTDRPVRYQDQQIGVADASLVVLAGRYRTDRLLTLDHRHFRVIRTTSGKPFTVLPKHRDT